MCIEDNPASINLRELVNLLWEGRIAIAVSTFCLLLGSITYSFFAQEWYRSEVLLAPVEDTPMSSLLGQFGGVAALAGINAGDGRAAQSVAELQSRELARQFIDDHKLIPVFFEDEWDSERARWRDDDPDEWPDVRDAVEYFHKHVISVSQDRRTSLVTLKIDWKDPALAATWANELVDRVNAKMRGRELREAATNVNYLRGELAKTNLVPLQQSIGKLLETELQRLMVAKGKEEFSFAVIDPGATPKRRLWPKRLLIVILGTVVGGLLGVLIVLTKHAYRKNEPAVRVK